MDAWCTKQHNESGLVQKVRDSQITLAQAEDLIIEFLQNTCQLKSFTCPLAGNSVGEDKKFLQKDMPKLYNFLHYRIIDVSTIKELCKRWIGDPTAQNAAGDHWKINEKIQPAFVKQCTHRALDDIRESIAELKHYKTHIFDKVINIHTQSQ
eukprot:403353981